jgi:hypothetical protein
VFEERNFMPEQLEKLIKNLLEDSATNAAGTLTTAFSGVVYYYGMVCRVLGAG